MFIYAEALDSHRFYMLTKVSRNSFKQQQQKAFFKNLDCNVIYSM